MACPPGLTADQLYFNIEQMGNTSAESIPIGIDVGLQDHTAPGRQEQVRPEYVRTHSGHRQSPQFHGQALGERQPSRRPVWM
jgi:hypothetical protein